MNFLIASKQKTYFWEVLQCAMLLETFAAALVRWSIRKDHLLQAQESN